MSLIALLASSMGSVKPITVNTDWGAQAVVVPGTATSATRTLTKPPTNPGNLRLDLVDGGTGGTKQYSKNAGAYTTYTDGTTITIANGDTLAFRDSGMTTANTSTVTVVDTTKNTTVGSFSALGI
jgi:hypothetical protein